MPIPQNWVIYFLVFPTRNQEVGAQGLRPGFAPMSCAHVLRPVPAPSQELGAKPFISKSLTVN
jgi:hypothetical protein